MQNTPPRAAEDTTGVCAEEADAPHSWLLSAERAGEFGYWRMDVATRMVDCSPGMVAVYGGSAVGFPAPQSVLEKLIHPDDQGKLEAAIEAAIADRGRFKCRYRAGERSNWYEARGHVECDGTGNPVAVVGVTQNVTEQVREEEGRLETQRIYKIMAEEASAIISLHPPGGGAFFVSNSFERVHGLRVSEVNLQSMFSRVHPDDALEAAKLKRSPVRGEAITATYRTRHAKGHYFWIETTTRAVFDDETGELVYVVASSRDVNERVEAELAVKAAQERAESANRAKSLFLANMSHELRTPLNAVIGFADVMRTEMFGALGNERYTEYAELIHESGQLLLDLISDILDMSKIEAGKFDLHYEDVDFGDLIAECLRLLAQRAARANLSLVAAPSGEAVRAFADRRAIKQILVNLISNSIKFTPPGGAIVVSATAEGGAVALSVSDEGIGIPEGDLPRLGKPFEQVCDDPTLAKGGTGLGLALVRALAEKHGGTMTIASAVGEGTTVTVRIPAKRAESAAA